MLIIFWKSFTSCTPETETKNEFAKIKSIVESYANAYTEYLARQGQYQQELLEAKVKAMDALRREHYLLTEPIDAYKSEKPAPIRGQDKPISRPDEIDILLLKRFNINTTQEVRLASL
ncbi:unnamed protein product, partial [Mesorhabditis spiculigera]